MKMVIFKNLFLFIKNLNKHVIDFDIFGEIEKLTLQSSFSFLPTVLNIFVDYLSHQFSP